MSDKKIRFAVVGAGKLGGFHSRTLSTMPEAELIGVSDPDKSRADKIAEEYKCLSFGDMRELLPLADAFVVAAPTVLHAKIGTELLEAGKHVLVEKPLASTEEGAARLIGAAKKAGRILQVGHSERFNGAVTETMKYIKDPKFIKIERLGPFDPRVAGTGVVLDLMIHDLDLALAITGSEPEKIEAAGCKLFSEFEDFCNARILFKNGCAADITASRMSAKPYRAMKVYQKDAYISVDYVAQKLKICKKACDKPRNMNDIKILTPDIQKKETLREELYHFIDCIKNKRQPVTSGEAGYRAVRLALAITSRMKRYDL